MISYIYNNIRMGDTGTRPAVPKQPNRRSWVKQPQMQSRVGSHAEKPDRSTEKVRKRIIQKSTCFCVNSVE